MGRVAAKVQQPLQQPPDFALGYGSIRPTVGPDPTGKRTRGNVTNGWRPQKCYGAVR